MRAPAAFAVELRRFDPSRVHLHGSPPCQRLSQANQTTPDPDEGLRLVRFFLDVVDHLRPRSFSMEQVCSPHVCAELERILH